MSRVAKNPVPIGNGVEADLKGNSLTVKGPKGSLGAGMPFGGRDGQARRRALRGRGAAFRFAPGLRRAMTGTTCARSCNNLFTGVSRGLRAQACTLVGTGYRAEGRRAARWPCTLGFSHPIELQGVGQDVSVTDALARPKSWLESHQPPARRPDGRRNPRRLRPPEPYKGKGVRYSRASNCVLKEAKKK